MNPDQLLFEGRRLARPGALLRPVGDGPVTGVWYERDDEQVETTGYRWWITVDAQRIPGLSPIVNGFISVLSDERRCQGGKVLVSRTWPDRPGTKLYSHAVSVLPPIEGVFAKGSDEVGAWLLANDWPRDERYNDNFPDRVTGQAYETRWFGEYPLYQSGDAYAILGGWHFPNADDDWYDLMDEQLMVLTLRDSEPWIEAWHRCDGSFHVVRRVT